MYKGIYVAMTGAQLKYQELDNVTQNLANANTAGYKKTSFSTRLYPLLEGIADKQKAVYPDARSMTVMGKTSIDTSAGSLMETGNTLDLACVGEGFFAVQAGDNIYYTRNGSFARGKDGYLVDDSGQQVLDTNNKPIRIAGNTVQFSSDGTLYVDGAATDKLKVVNLDRATMQHIGNSLFSGTETGASNAEVVQGSVEMSNVNPIKEMAGMITALRDMDIISKVIKTFDTLAENAVTQIAKV
ncbi:MAG: flagellar hook basal-body protein [Nitrospirae bacterium]|nr:flagellar hook basal-body protein [Nitrospirota bacterium]